MQKVFLFELIKKYNECKKLIFFNWLKNILNANKKDYDNSIFDLFIFLVFCNEF